MTTRIFGLLILILVLLPWPAVAAPTDASPKPAAASPVPGGAVSVEELQRLVNTLQDEKARAQLVGELQALIAVQRGQQQKQEASPAAIVTGLSAQIDAISGEILAAASVVVDAPLLVGWFEGQITDAEARSRWLERGLKLGIIFGAALLAEWLARLLLRRPGARLARSGGSRMAQLTVMLLQLVVCAVPVLVFAGVAYVIVPLIQPSYVPTAYVAQVIIQAALTARLILVFAQIALLSPAATVLYPLSDETRNYLYIWARRFTNWSIYGFALATGAWWLGVPGAIYALLLRGTMLVLGILSIMFVLQNRGAVAGLIRGRPRAGSSDPAPSRGWALVRHRFSETWHVLAIVYIVATFGSYVVNIEGGFIFVFRATVVSLVVLGAAGIIVRMVKRLSQRGFAIGDDLKRRYPTLEARANRYLPVLTIVASLIVYSFAAAGLLQAWGIDAFAWFSTEIGRRMAGSLFSIVTVLVGALVLWELFGAVIERYLNGNGSSLSRPVRSARARTLLPLLRTTVLIVLIVVVALIILSQLGVDIAPLLAGAGVVGLAIGFGSQALVKDVITGLFILLEDTLAIGDVVDVGNNHAGVVEALSIRTIRLRDQAGTVHTIPFSDVTTVKNLTKDFSYYLANIGVSYREDTDQVIEVLKEVAEEMRQDKTFGPMMLEPMEVIGVDRFEDSAVIIMVRLKTPPIRQWTVGREFNRRLKKAFDRYGIEMPYPHRTVYFGEDKRGNAPAAHIRVDQVTLPEPPIESVSDAGSAAVLPVEAPARA